MPASRSSRARQSSEDMDSTRNRDSHDLSLNIAAPGRESLLDNLLSSFDLFDSLGTFDNTAPYFSTVDEVEDNDTESNYSRRRSHSLGGDYNLNAGLGTRQLDSSEHRHELEDSLGLAHDERRDNTRSRGGRALGSSHGFSNVYDPYDAAPAPSIRSGPRNRSPSPPKLVRRPSNKSIKSLRRDINLQLDEQIALPPLPAFANPPPPVQVMALKNKAANRPGFFRRVFGGGTSNDSAVPKSNASSPAPSTPPPPRKAPVESPPPVITKKPSSFFRRRKKSLSDAINQPPIPAPINPAGDPPPPAINDAAVPSPVTSLRAAMNPYLHSPAKSPNFPQTRDEREIAYLSKNATIRTVSSPDNSSSRRPSFFGESPRNRDTAPYADPGDGSGKKYKKESWNARGSNSHIDEPFETPKDNTLPTDADDRPQTSSHSPFNRTFFRDDDEPDVPWPPSPKKGILSRTKSVDNVNPGELSKEHPTVSVMDVEDIEGMPRKGSKASGSLELDTKNLGLPAKQQETSWISTPTPATATPTVTLQRAYPEEETTVLEELDHSTQLKGDGEPSDEDRDCARKIFEGDEEFVSKARAAAWLGDSGDARSSARTAYMEMFDWSGMNILSSMRMFCGRLVFKGETQQVDRIIDAFSKRWCECNPNHGFKSADIVHTILYSLLLLNTDLHLADIPNSQKMTRSQFIKNTMATIRRGLADANQAEEPKLVHNATVPVRSQTPFRQNSGDESPTLSTSHSGTFPISSRDKKLNDSRPSLESARNERSVSRLSRIGNMSPKLPSEEDKADYEMDGGLTLVNSPLSGPLRLWETQLELILKDFYQSVKASALPLHGSSQERIPESNSLSVFGSGMLRRSPSNVSRAASEMSSGRHRENSAKLGSKWAAKNRSRQRVYNNGSYAGSSRTSFDDRSMWSPSASSTWSKYSLDRTQTSMSMESFGSAAFSHGDYQQSIGFANALSHAIIREEAASATSGEDVEVNVFEVDEELELAGAPWAKEGMVKHKHHLESVDKRAKNRGWTQCFAVIQRGYMQLFLFPSKNSNKNPHVSGGVVGGGNWTENAEPIGKFLLRQTIASALPPPGYSKARPDVWALSLPSGAVHFFEVGTTEIVKEFVSTANYWSARLSKEPLIGGVSNVEYGWGNCIVDIDTSGSPPPSNHGDAGRPSLQMSIRSSMDHGSIRPRLPGDKIHIKDWSPPQQSMVASSLSEQDQLKALENYVANIETELKKHNELRHAMQLAFSPRHPNSLKAMSNWEKKSSYLLREIIKFRTYIETLQTAIGSREKFKVGQEQLMADKVDEEVAPKPSKFKVPEGI